MISNHDLFRGLVEWPGFPYHYVPVTPATKAAAYEEIVAHFEAAQGDVMVLARYMQILSAQMCDRYAGRIINYVSEDLDCGPIIDQDVLRIDHADSPEDLVRFGKDIEKTVLARGLRYHVEERVLVHNQPQNHCVSLIPSKMSRQKYYTMLFKVSVTVTEGATLTFISKTIFVDA